MDRFDTTGYSCSRRAPQHSQLICCLNSVRSINAGLHHRLHARTCTDLVTPNTQTRLLRQIILKEKLYIILAVATILVECTDATRILALNEEQQNCATAANTSIYAAAAFTDKEMSVLQQLVLQTKGQETTYDRTLVMRALAIREHKARMLVFGCGRDSVFWAKHMNRHGETVFLEDNKEWAALNVGLKTHLVKYNTAPLQTWLDKMDADAASADRHNAWTPLNEQQIASLSITGAPAGLFEQWWDVILVDAPMGFVPTEHPGRLAPIYMSASMLARQRARRPCAAVDVFVHDFDRRAEREWALTFLTPHSRLVNAADGLALQRAKQGGGTVDGAKYMAWFHSP
mmetsp:Transcript_12280/g.26545  ORF Transcript_12280/g.26545 Transcript_12280/m.26545 type:complete len:344 (-) Transcript_12280:1319-2350(-)